MPKRTVSFRDELLKDLLDPAYATDYVAACAVDGDVAIAVRDIIDSATLAERERCAKIADGALMTDAFIGPLYGAGHNGACKYIAAAIRNGE